MEVRVVEFHPKHLEVMQVRDIDAQLFGGFKTEESYVRVEQMAKSSIQCATFIYDGRILFVAGFCKMWSGVFEVWMLPSVYARTAPFYFARTLRRYIDRIAADFKAHRIQTMSFDDEFHLKWMNFLGFKKEGTAEKFTQDQKDMCNFGRVF